MAQNEKSAGINQEDRSNGKLQEDRSNGKQNFRIGMTKRSFLGKNLFFLESMSINTNSNELLKSIVAFL